MSASPSTLVFRLLPWEDPYHCLVRRHLGPFIRQPDRAQTYLSQDSRFIENCRTIFERSRHQGTFSEGMLLDAYTEFAFREMHKRYACRDINLPGTSSYPELVPDPPRDREAYCLAIARAVHTAVQHDFRNTSEPTLDALVEHAQRALQENYDAYNRSSVLYKKTNKRRSLRELQESGDAPAPPTKRRPLYFFGQPVKCNNATKN